MLKLAEANAEIETYRNFELSERIGSDMEIGLVIRKYRREKHLTQEELARLFEMGRYNEAAGGLELAVAEQDKEAVIEIVQDLLAGIEDIAGYRNSTLYMHINFKEPRKEFLAELKQNFLKSFRDEETFGFLEEDPRWQELIKQETAAVVY